MRHRPYRRRCGQQHQRADEPCLQVQEPGVSLHRAFAFQCVQPHSDLDTTPPPPGSTAKQQGHLVRFYGPSK